MGAVRGAWPAVATVGARLDRGSFGHEPSSGQRPITPAVGVPAMRQRGFYTELLDAEMDPAQVSAIAQDASRGSVDPMLQPQLAVPVQKVVPAAQFEAGIDDAIQAASNRRAMLGMARSRPGTAQGPGYGSAPSRALEPKVLVPYIVGPGKTPRKIAIERQKRLFAMQVVASARNWESHCKIPDDATRELSRITRSEACGSSGCNTSARAVMSRDGAGRNCLQYR